MRKHRASLWGCFAIFLAGCSTLDSSSSFDDVAKSVKDRHNYVQVIAHDITPDTQAVIGADVIKSSLFYVGNFAKQANTEVKSSYVDMQVSSFKNYDRFSSVIIDGESLSLTDYRPQAETCTEHCTVTQWFQFPLSEQTLAKVDGESVQFTLVSGTKNNMVKFIVPKAYFLAVEQEAQYTIHKQPSNAAQAETLPLALNGSKSQDMVQYWYGEGSIADKKQFTDWAFSQRTTVTQMIQTDSKPVEMMVYWYDKANKTEKSHILSWLINQE